MNFSLQEITTAYRKAKADAWLRHDLRVVDYFWYEQNFRENVLSFKKFIADCSGRGDFTADWLGGWRLMAKKIKMKELDPDEDMALSSDPNENFNDSRIDNVAYRLMAAPSVNFQILSSLWILRVGWKYEKKLSGNIYGNRLRPLDKKSGKPSLATRGSFRFYRPMFTKWKRDGISSLTEVLKGLNGGRAIVVTADAKAFFHSLKPDFLLDKQFLADKKISLTREDRALTKLLIDAITVWAEATPLKTGLPVGLAASSVIANIALLDFDRAFEGIDGRVFYGRYVDDLLLVFRNPTVRTRSDVWKCIARASTVFCPYVMPTDSKEGSAKEKIIGVKFMPDYVKKLTASGIVFTGEKCRAFFLDEKTGPSFVETLNSQIQDVTSEFRYLPHNIFEEGDVERKIQKLLSKDGEDADNFRKIDIFTIRKKDLKELLREMQFLLKTLPPDVWKSKRKAFYDLIGKHLMLPFEFIEYAERDFPQVVTLAVLCGDFSELAVFLRRVSKVCKTLRDKKALIAGSIDIPIQQNVIAEKWIDELFSNYASNIKMAFRDAGGEVYDKAYLKFRDDCQQYFARDRLIPLSSARAWARQSVLHDLGAHSFVEHLYCRDVRPLTGQATRWRCSSVGFVDVVGEFPGWFDDEYINAAVFLGRHVKWPKAIDRKCIPFALVFPTRPIAERDIAWLDNCQPLQEVDFVFRQLRGYVPGVQEPELVRNVFGEVESRIVKNPDIVNPTVALLNIKTEVEFCYHNIKGVGPEKFFSRLKDVVEVINVVISQKGRIDYLVMHELSLPMRWFLAIAGHCTEHGISLIAGTTYNVTDIDKRLCKNEVCMALVRSPDGRFSQPEFIREAKTSFSREETYALRRDCGQYEIDNRIPLSRHVVVRHGAFAFSVLICSELTEIINRCRLRGLIDALFVVEWNQDINSFSSIVESAAMDLHAYVVQSNNNMFGDSRIRVPRNKEWARDVVRLRGGDGAFCVIGKLDVAALRRFQLTWDPEEYFSKIKSSDEPSFKPIPIGYENDIADYRREVREEPHRKDGRVDVECEKE